VSLVVAGLLAGAAALPAVWWEPLHIDEAVTLGYAPESVPAIARDIFVERGGAPAFFFVEHLSLRWPGGLAGLRLPPLLFFLIALGLSFLVARDLCGRQAALLLPPLLAAAPLAVRLSTFARMYTLFLAGVLLAVWLLLRAESRGGRRGWIAAGAAAGALVYIHPIAPLYAALALATAFLRSGEGMRDFLRRSRPGLLALGLVAVPYVYALAVLSRRYGVGSTESAVLESASGHAVPVESVLALGAGTWLGAALLFALAGAGLVGALGRDPRTGVALALWVAVPVVFFSLVPAETAFFPRYLLPALPFFLLLVVLGSLQAGRLVGRPFPAAAALVAAIVVVVAVDTVPRLERLRDLRLPSMTGEVAEIDGAVLLSSTGAAVAGRPSELLDAYASLEVPGAGRLEELLAADPGHSEGLRERGTAAVREFLARSEAPRRGVWLLTGRPRRLDLAADRLAAVPGVETARISPTVLLVRSTAPLEPRALIEQSIAVRTAWLGPDGRDRWSQTLLDIEREALGGTR
jgi:hypothetical protein